MTAKEVRAIRHRLKLTQQELADRIGVARNTVTRWEIGLLGIREPTARLLKFLAAGPIPATSKARAPGGIEPTSTRAVKSAGVRVELIDEEPGARFVRRGFSIIRLIGGQKKGKTDGKN
jgi:transcriptional regulator with XRE-family HTH domain